MTQRTYDTSSGGFYGERVATTVVPQFKRKNFCPGGVETKSQKSQCHKYQTTRMTITHLFWFKLMEKNCWTLGLAMSPSETSIRKPRIAVLGVAYVALPITWESRFGLNIYCMRRGSTKSSNWAAGHCENEESPAAFFLSPSAKANMCTSSSVTEKAKLLT